MNSIIFLDERVADLVYMLYVKTVDFRVFRQEKFQRFFLDLWLFIKVAHIKFREERK